MSQLTHIDRLISDNRPKEAASRLASLDPSEMSDGTLSWYRLLNAEARLYLGDCHPKGLDEAVEFYRFHKDTSRFARAKYLKGWMLLAQGRHNDAKEILLEAYTGFLRCREHNGAARALNHLALVSFQQGNIRTALESLDRCRELYSESGHPDKAVAVATNACYLLYTAGQIRRAITEYAGIAPLVLKQGDRNRLIFYEMSAVPHALLGEIETARETIAKAEPYLDDYPREKAIYLENLGLIELLDGCPDRAIATLDEGLKLSLKVAPESALISQIRRLLGEAHLAANRFGPARDHAEQALMVAERIGEQIEVAACKRIFAQYDYKYGQTSSAKALFRQALQLFAGIGAQYELAVTRCLAAESGLYGEAERTALLYLAGEYFESERMSRWHQRCQRQLPGMSPLESSQGEGTGPTIVTRDPKMKEILKTARHVARSDMTVLLTGETGTGKDVLARYIHAHSGRTGEFVPVNAAAIPGSMAEAELFGYALGSFTGAQSDRPGLIEQADKGTFYLNEVADAGAELQAKLLEVLETRQVRRLGENNFRSVEFRLIAATNHDLEQRLRDGVFRADLYHRLNEIPIHLPPLSERDGDIAYLVRHFLSELDPSIVENGHGPKIERLASLLSFDRYPGNVRQLRSRVRQLHVLSRGNLDDMIAGALPGDDELARLKHALSCCGWNRSEAARMMGCSEATIRRRIKEHHLMPGECRSSPRV
jgi:DNA-binding NtrC family response regulator